MDAALRETYAALKRGKINRLMRRPAQPEKAVCVVATSANPGVQQSSTDWAASATL